MDVEDGIILCEDLLERIDELPERAEVFTESVRETVSGIMLTIESKNVVTPNQIRALENIADGVNRWLERN